MVTRTHKIYLAISPFLFSKEPFPTPPSALPQADFTDQWVSQAATATAAGTAIPPPQTPTHSMYGDDHHNEDDDDNYEDFPAEVFVFF